MNRRFWKYSAILLAVFTLAIAAVFIWAPRFLENQLNRQDIGAMFKEATGGTFSSKKMKLRLWPTPHIIIPNGQVDIPERIRGSWHTAHVFPALAPIIYNVGIIGGGLIGAAASEATPEAFLWGALVGSAIGNFGIQVLGARNTGTWFTQTAGQSAVREYLVLAIPLMVGQSVAVLDEQFARVFGQVEEGAASALTLARQLNMVPVGVIAQAAGVAWVIVEVATKPVLFPFAFANSRMVGGDSFVSP